MMKKMVVLGSLIAICVFMFVALFVCSTLSKYKKKIAATTINNINLGEIKNGKYEGFYDVYLINARVILKVESNKIVSIELIEHKYDRYSGEPMIQKVIDKQSLEVDAISGATNSSKTVLKAIEIALSKGKK